MFTGKRRKSSASTGTQSEMGSDVSRSRRSSKPHSSTTPDDLDSTTIHPESDPRRKSSISDREQSNDEASMRREQSATDGITAPPFEEQSSIDSRSIRIKRSQSVSDGQIEPRDSLTGPAISKTKTRRSASQRPSASDLELDVRVKPSLTLTNLKNPGVIREATKLVKQLDKFKAGLELAQTGGYKILSGFDVEAELQKIFNLADSNVGGDEMLRQLADATSFSGKRSAFQPTTEAGRAQVRIVQLFKAVQGDGSYATIKSNINDLAKDATTLRQLARDANLLQTLDVAQYVDANRLLRTVDNVPAKLIDQTTLEWHIEQASLMKAYQEQGANPALQSKLALTMLQSYAKVAPLGALKSRELGAQGSPFQNDLPFYYRSNTDANRDPLQVRVTGAYCKEMGIAEGSMHLVDNSTFRDVLAREYVMPGVNSKISNRSDYDQALQALFSKAERGEFPANRVVLDITDLFQQSGQEPKEITGLRTDLEQTFLNQAEKFLADHPDVDQDKFAGLMRNLQIGAMATHKGTDVLLIPPFLSRNPDVNYTKLQDSLLKKVGSKHTDFFNAIEHSKIHSGYRLDPIQARKAWLEVAKPSDILKRHEIQLTELATSNKPTPKVFAKFEDLTKHGTFQQFEALASNPNAPPYLKTLPNATVNLLRGLATYDSVNGGVDKIMQDQGLGEILQTAYYRMLNAMAAAVDSHAFLTDPNFKDPKNRLAPSQISKKFVSFMNQVEVIQQQIATIVSLVEPHSNNAFGDSIRDRLTNPNGLGGKPIIPVGLDKPGVQLKPSAMHCLASILSSVEALKKGNDLNVCVVKDHYYESAGAVSNTGTYSVSTFDGDAVRDPNSDRMLPLDPDTIKGKKPLDLYVCDFHHNISIGRNHYQVENLQHHVDELYRTNLVADKFTVAIDCTIDYVNSKDVQDFLEHNKERIASGKLNVVLFRSAQKFDMFGMDNYYGGFTVNVNKHTAFSDFNTRMATPQDQLKGPSLQGLSHIGVNAPQDMDAYRNALMTNTKRFYNTLPSGLIWSEGSTSVMQVAKTDDPNAVFLDIKFPDNVAASNAFEERFRAFAEKEGLPLTQRSSFGFATTNLNLIHGEKTRLTPGLEGPEIQDRYIAFLGTVYQYANAAANKGTQKGLQGDALKAFIATEIQNIPLTNIEIFGSPLL